MLLGTFSLIAAIAISLGYSWWVKRHFKGKGSFETWLHTLVSVVVAALIAVFIFYFQNYLTDRHNRQKFLDLLRTEFSANLAVLNDPTRKTFLPPGGGQIKAHMFDLRELAVEDAIRSGCFDYKETMSLYLVLDGIKAIRWDRDAIENISLSTVGTTDNLREAAGLIEQHNQMEVTAINQAAVTLHITLTATPIP